MENKILTARWYTVRCSVLTFHYRIRKQEKDLYEKCKAELGLEFLEKDDSVMPDMMIECLERLLVSAYRLSPLLTGARLWVTHYYAVMGDGEVCIPWNWDQEKS